jgi:hypothetical protein
MKAPAQTQGATALVSLLEARARLTSIEDEDYAAVFLQLARKHFSAKGLKAPGLLALRDTIGEAHFESILKDLPARRLGVLARLFDRTMTDEKLALAPGPAAQLLRLMPPARPSEKPPEAAPEKIEAPAETSSPEPKPVTAVNSYFGRKAFRAGD